MSLRFWMAAKAIVEVVFGIGFVAVPAYLADLFGMDFNETGELMARLFGTAFIFGAIVLWLAQNASHTEKALQAIVIGVILSNAIGFVVTLMATLADTWNALGWLPVGLYLVFGLVFAYFLFTKPRLT